MLLIANAHFQLKKKETCKMLNIQFHYFLKTNMWKKHLKK